MVLTKKSSFSSILCILLILTLISPLVLQPLQAKAMTAPIWNTEFKKDIDWIIKTDFDVLIVGSDNNLYFLSQRRGQQLWSIESGPDIKRTDVSIIEGTDILLVNRSDDNSNIYTLEAYELLTGNKVWSTQVGGKGISVVPILQKWSFLYIIDDDGGKEKVKPHIYNMNIFNGKTIWESTFDSSFNGTKSSGVLCFGDRYDVSGFYPPICVDNDIYFFYDGLRKFDYRSGLQQWYVPYTVNSDETLIKADADAIITDKFIYTSGAGVIRATKRSDGTVQWASENFGLVPLMYYDGTRIYGQIGGTFCKANFQDTENISPLGVFALDVKTGTKSWDFRDCKDIITNIVPTKDRIYFADSLSLIGLDKKTGKSVFKSTLGFSNPVLTVADEVNRRVIVQSGQRVGRFNMDNGNQIWAAGFKEQELGFFDKLSTKLLIGTAIIIFTGGLATAVLLGGYAAYDMNRTMNRNSAQDRLYRQAMAEKAFWGGLVTYRNTPGSSQASKIRKERLDIVSKQKDIYFYVYGEDQSNSDIKGVGGIDIDTGKMDFEIDLDNDRPVYQYDRIYGLLFYTNGNQLATYKLY